MFCPPIISMRLFFIGPTGAQRRWRHAINRLASAEFLIAARP
jgi:hypothetical protein